MQIRKLASLLAAAASAAGLVAYGRFRKEMRAIVDAVDAGGTIAETSAGEVEYAETGDGAPMLLIHGAGGGYDQGLLIGGDLGDGFRIIAPSRFGYLKTPVPADPSLAAQADAHAALLDFLDVRTAVVVGVSAGAPSAIELALRHPDRVSALILLVPRAYDPTQSVGVDQGLRSQAVLRLIETSSDFLFWTAMRVARSAVVRFLGVPPEVEGEAAEDERARVTKIMRSILPLSKRVRGIALDSATELSEWPLEHIAVPVLIVSAEDDLFRTLPGARFTAQRIPGAELHILKSGGHLMVEQTERVRGLVRSFLEKGRTKAPKRKPAGARREAQLEPA